MTHSMALFTDAGTLDGLMKLVFARQKRGVKGPALHFENHDEAKRATRQRKQECLLHRLLRSARA